MVTAAGASEVRHKTKAARTTATAVKAVVLVGASRLGTLESAQKSGKGTMGVLFHALHRLPHVLPRTHACVLFT